MTSRAIRDQATDHLLTPWNSALILIDYQPVQVKSVKSMEKASTSLLLPSGGAMLRNERTIARAASLSRRLKEGAR